MENHGFSKHVHWLFHTTDRFHFLLFLLPPLPPLPFLPFPFPKEEKTQRYTRNRNGNAKTKSIGESCSSALLVEVQNSSFGVLPCTTSCMQGGSNLTGTSLFGHRILEVQADTVAFFFSVSENSQNRSMCAEVNFLPILLQAFMLRRAAEEPLGHAAAIVADVLENAETNHVINASQKRALLQEMALRLS